eukprot:4261205-Amphidinium_carterae.1
MTNYVKGRLKERSCPEDCFELYVQSFCCNRKAVVKSFVDLYAEQRDLFIVPPQARAECVSQSCNAHIREGILVCCAALDDAKVQRPSHSDEARAVAQHLRCATPRMHLRTLAVLLYHMWSLMINSIECTTYWVASKKTWGRMELDDIMGSECLRMAQHEQSLWQLLGREIHD